MVCYHVAISDCGNGWVASCASVEKIRCGNRDVAHDEQCAAGCGCFDATRDTVWCDWGANWIRVGTFEVARLKNEVAETRVSDERISRHHIRIVTVLKSGIWE